jgi:hypothetical protein
MERRQFITLLGGAAAAWPRLAHAQQPNRVRQIGVLMGWDERDPDAKLWLSGFMRGLAELGWTNDRNLRVEARWEGDSVDRMQMFAKELVSLQPDVILSSNISGDRCPSARDADDPDRICDCLRPSRRRLRGGPAAPGWESYWLNVPRSVDGEQIAGVTH